jgi:hypothetical protein
LPTSRRVLDFAPPPLDHDKMHEVNWAHLERLGVTLQAKPSQREGGLDDDADYQTAYQSARKSLSQRRTRVSNRRLRARPPHRLTFDGMEGQGSSP